MATTKSKNLWGGILELGYEQPGSYDTTPAMFVKLVKLGFVKQLASGEYKLTAKGRRALTVAESGDGEVPELDHD